MGPACYKEKLDNKYIPTDIEHPETISKMMVRSIVRQKAKHSTGSIQSPRHKLNTVPVLYNLHKQPKRKTKTHKIVTTNTTVIVVCMVNSPQTDPMKMNTAI